ncbi:hypothetical protein [Actinokineospora fastidiosa]|uniref:Uncharacterized protein n=1 Tax=Actinokineospora fastidiosa TaxID=1816 RepID=A0A918GDE3_9PSEU|nr:hypothetical protein [Actinokineospora fastidiosa]GGS30082.1 hypothetical protein GCM10010171_24420 [Actinokineospora fastidiosa]
MEAKQVDDVVQRLEWKVGRRMQDVGALGREFHTHLLPSVAALPEIVG